MTKAFKAKVSPNGDVTAVYSDHIPYSKLGNMVAERQATITFSSLRQKWIARYHGVTIASHKNRSELVKLEQKYFEDKL